MIYDSLEEPLARIAPKIPRNHQLITLNPDSAKYQWIDRQRVDEQSPLFREFLGYIEQVEALSSYAQAHMRRSPSGSQSVKVNDLAHWMLAQAKFRSASDIIQDLARFVEDNEVAMYEVAALWGIHPSESIELQDDIELVPLESLLPSQPKDQLTGVRDTLYTEGSGFPSPRPDAALIAHFTHGPVLAPMGLSQDWPFNISLFENIIRALVVATGRAVVQISNWFQCDVNVPVIGGVLGWGGRATEHAFTNPIPIEQFDADYIRKTVQQYLELNEDYRNKLSIPADRLSIAMRAGDLRTKAIELGIVIEALLTTHGERDSLSYRIRQRGALLIGGDSGKIQDNYRRLKALYDMRSRAVHGGAISEELTWNGCPISTWEFLKEGEAICTELLQVLVNRGQFPDWNALIMQW